MKILLLSAYDAVSHRQWREGLVRHLGDYRWTVLTLPPRNFAWRSRGNALSWAFGDRDVLTSGYDRVVATSMTDMAELRGLVPELARIPSIVYYHENQFAYPERMVRKEGQNYLLTNIFTALAADRVVFNSRFNRRTMLDGARDLLQAMPDCVPDGIISSIKERSRVLPVPLEESCYVPHRGPPAGVPLTLVWNHRWEYDKAPERLFQALDQLSAAGAEFKVHVLGQRFRECPAVFEQAKKRLQGHIGRWGYIEDDGEYRRILAASDVILSTSLHDFQGLAVLEGVAAGCYPLVPDRLAYRELFAEEYRYSSHAGDPETECRALVARLRPMCSDPGLVRGVSPPDLSGLSWPTMMFRYRELIDSCNILVNNAIYN